MAVHSFFVVSFVSFDFWGMSFGGLFVEERLLILGKGKKKLGSWKKERGHRLIDSSFFRANSRHLTGNYKRPNAAAASVW
ncbi:unnamed protein product [Prunus armeniaca]|uniref:Uncharacterized protein n=1 Tax=Prunus armeniaca TaxID=36596 RepID=A0A6J5XDR4_PRUAR|nr:unnamed protein product [Prunus armeniaca]